MSASVRPKAITPSHLTAQALAYRDARATWVRALEAIARAEADVAAAKEHAEDARRVCQAHADELLKHAAVLENGQTKSATP